MTVGGELKMSMLFGGWDSLLHTAVVGGLAYVAVVLMLRFSGKRTLAKWHAFDFVVTVAFGSALATAFLSSDASLTQVILAFTLLLTLQFIVAWSSLRSRSFRRIVRTEPSLLLYRGGILHEELRAERVTERELYAALREKGLGSVSDAGAAILESNGEISVIRMGELGDGSTLQDIRNMPVASES